ncbi:MAG: glycosyltransferase [Kiritimatiellae bacterium]|nr:glycosyltransferase [Kiritimatiellia bacterium]MDW8458789.1 glycosyltransferase [Verrucomicrobiota bacterium]
MSPLISVLMPIRNAAATLPTALESLRRQTLQDFELIAVDHGSDDESRALLEGARGAFRDLRIVSVPRDLPFAEALNEGLRQARGEWIARMDADDESTPERLETQWRVAWSDPSLDVVACRVRFGGDRANRAGYARYVDWINTLLTHEEMARARFRESPLAHPSVLIRRGAFERFGAYRAGAFPEDYELWLRWFEAGARFAKCPETLLTWNDPPRRLSRTDPRYSFEAFYRVKAGYLARWLAANNPHHPDVLVIGAGRVTRRRVEFFMEAGIRVAAWSDLDPRKVGRRYHGAPVIHHEEIPPPGECFIVTCVSAIGAPESIRSMLLSRGYMPGRDFIEAA